LGVLFHQIFPWGTSPSILGAFFVFHLSADLLTLVMLLTIGLVALVALMVAAGTLAPGPSRFQFVQLLLICVIGMNAVVLVRDVFSLYVFIEITSIASFILIALDKNKSAIEGTFKYLILSAIATIFLLSAAAFFLLVAGDLSFAAIQAAFLNPANGGVLKLATALFLCGLFVKSGVMPFHGWLPDAYASAPACVSVLLAGIVTKIVGVYGLLRLLGPVFVLTPALQEAVLFLGAFSIVVAALAALTQDDFKRMLSYSSISQIGYIVLAIGCGTPLAFAGAVFHFFNHAIFKSLLFVNAASLEKQYGSTDMNRLAGLGSKMPVTGVTSLVGMLSTAGVPPLSGFWSKLIIIVALFVSGRSGYASVALLASILTLAYFLSFQRRVFFSKTHTILEGTGKSPLVLRSSEIFLSLLTMAGGLVLFLFKGMIIR
jgi:multicomponent Na+:H+ antiporter subunit D